MIRRGNQDVELATQEAFNAIVRAVDEKDGRKSAFKKKDAVISDLIIYAETLRCVLIAYNADETMPPVDDIEPVVARIEATIARAKEALEK